MAAFDWRAFSFRAWRIIIGHTFATMLILRSVFSVWWHGSSSFSSSLFSFHFSALFLFFEYGSLGIWSRFHFVFLSLFFLLLSFVERVPRYDSCATTRIWYKHRKWINSKLYKPKRSHIASLRCSSRVNYRSRSQNANYKNWSFIGQMKF